MIPYTTLQTTGYLMSKRKATISRTSDSDLLDEIAELEKLAFTNNINRVGVEGRLRAYIIRLKKDGCGRREAAAVSRIAYTTIMTQRAVNESFSELENVAERLADRVVHARLFKEASRKGASVGHIALYAKLQRGWVEPKHLIEHIGVDKTIPLDALSSKLRKAIEKELTAFELDPTCRPGEFTSLAVVGRQDD